MIATGSLLLKLIDTIIFKLEGKKLQCDQLQFGSQADASTVMCTWTATTVIEYYNQGAMFPQNLQTHTAIHTVLV